MYLVDVCFDSFVHTYSFEDEESATGFVVLVLEEGNIHWEEGNKAVVIPLHRIKCFEIYKEAK